MNDLVNSQAYDDVLDRLPPSLPADEKYMAYYRYWRSIANFPEDQLEPD